MPEPIAIVGMGCRLPAAAGLEAYWDVLWSEVDAVREVPPQRWDADSLYATDFRQSGTMNSRWGGFLDGYDEFDAEFFGISAREAGRIDPQQRLALEVAVEALDDAGVPLRAVSGSSTGVFFGVSTYDHGAAVQASARRVEAYDGTGASLSIVANRLSYCLNLRGPSVSVDTACSSSLVAVHLAVQALRAGEADHAIAGGVNVITSPAIGMSFSRGGLLSPDGRCKSFDHGANGYVRSEGVGAVLLKPLDRAIADGDRVYATILGGAMNQDGRTNGLNAPNGPAQESVLRAAYRSADVDPSAVQYVEAHGTGTAVGDPIEIGALNSVLGVDRDPAAPLRVSSAKSNLGHLEAAAGVAGLIKTALCVWRRRLPGTVHYERPNPMLALEKRPIVVQEASGDWPGHDGPALAGVSSFGFGGTNVHLVLSDAPALQFRTATGDHGTPQLFVLSGRSEAELRQRAANWAAHAPTSVVPDRLPAVAAAMALRTDHERYRATLVATDVPELAARLRDVADGEPSPDVAGPGQARRRPPRPVFVFPGQGAQWLGMGQQLAAAEPAFREAIRRCAEVLRPHLATSLWTEEGLQFEGTEAVQPAVFAIQVALAETLAAWGVRPAAVVGHSMGEIAAAHISGALSLEDAARVVCERSRLLAEISGDGGMLLTELPVEEAHELVRGRERELAVAVSNSPRSTVLSGSAGALDELAARLTEQGVFARKVAVEFAAHSPEVEQVRPRLREAVEAVVPRSSPLQFYSTVTGDATDGGHLDADYWSRNAREPVLFTDAVRNMLRGGHEVFVEIAPHPMLTRSISEIAADSGENPVATVPVMHRDEDERRGLRAALGRLFVEGVPVDFAALYPDGVAHVPFPLRQWQHQRFESVQVPTGAGAMPARGPDEGDLLADRVLVDAEPELALWILPFSTAALPELADHMVEDVAIVPGTYWVAAVVEAATLLSQAREAVVLADVVFARPRPLSDEDVEVQLAIRPSDGGSRAFLTTSRSVGGEPLTHVRGRVVEAGEEWPQRPALEDLRARCGEQLPVDRQYERFADVGLRYGPRFRSITELAVGEGEALARVELSADVDPGSVPLHPALLDGCLQSVGVVSSEFGSAEAIPLPMAIGRLWSCAARGPLTEVWCHTRVLRRTERELLAEVSVLDLAGEPVWTAADLRVRLSAPRRAVERGRTYEIGWHPFEPKPGPEGGKWLLLRDSGGVAEELARALEAADSVCTLATSQESTVDGHSQLLPAGDELRGVVDARALDPAGIDGTTLQDHAGRVLSLSQALAQRPGSAKPALWVLTAGTHGPSGTTDASALAGATLCGLGRTIANESADAPCTLVDVERTADAADIDVLARLLRVDGAPSQLAVRDGRVSTPGLVPGGAPGALPAIREEGTYVITGGLGALGKRVARWLVERGARRLLLVARSEPDADTAAELDRMRSAGVDVAVARADVSDLGDLDKALSGLDIAGVFHLAGALADGALAELGSDSLAHALRAKALGAWNLHELLRDREVELFVLFSSVAGVLGSPGQGAYAAANTFLDSLARHRAALGLPASSISFGPWSGAGLAVSAGGEDRLAAMGIPFLEPEIAIELLEDAIASRASHIVACAFDPGNAARAGMLPAAQDMLGAVLPGRDAPAPKRAGRDAVLAATSAADRRSAIREVLIGHLASLIGAKSSEVDIDKPFQELGFDSMMAVELRNQLEHSLDIRLSAAMVYAYPTAHEFADALLDQLAEGSEPESAPTAEEQNTDEEDLSELDADGVADLLAVELGQDREEQVRDG